ncbi:VWA domain-containing protein [Aquabacterium sp. J223]|uniref:VWA domain-containing protein n=1 Tax=Aquabacterium sp. J223 TaxID=2898431 RepID=UPI0021ADD9A6|nr:VWA domain-containing protein [Aquabacterium sp. J223]UUX95776.1 VWA domain-containing protein [Aquabacterium sp. J223]
MTFLWPELLWTLAALPLLVALYLWLLSRRKKAAVRYSGLALVREAQGRGGAWRRHLPPLLLLLALAALLLATARPSVKLTLPSQQRMVILSMDVSGSMRATDVKPNRMLAMQAAAREFVQAQPASTRIGIVTFAGTAALVQPPTFTKDDLMAAIDRFNFQRGTAVGSGILVSLQTIFPDMDFELLRSDPRRSASSGGGRPIDLNPGSGTKPPPPPVPPGSYGSAVIVLLTDGQTTTGPNPIEAARMAAERGVRVYTVGVGTDNGETLTGDGWSMRVRLDEASLKQIANTTGGEYYYAGTAPDLQKVYQTLHSKLSLETRETEVSALLAAAAAVLLVLSAGLSLLWFHRVS